MWFEIIEKMNNTNTYKPAFGKAIVEIIYSGRKLKMNSNHKVVIEFEDIAECMIRYYWNQSFFFSLKQQGGNITPTIYQLVNKLIDKYKSITDSNIPKWSDEGLALIRKEDEAFYQKIVHQTAREINKYVAECFTHVNSETKPIYEYDRKLGLFLLFDPNDIIKIRDYAFVLTKLLNYRWSILLEKYNVAPNILNKVSDIGNEKMRRNSLAKYRMMLEMEYPDNNPIDFYSHDPLEEKDISVDHVIPWSFLYRDDIWNLVLTSKSNNSLKSNHIPSEETIQRLEERNMRLYPLITDKSMKESMKEAISLHLVRRYYFELIG